MNHFVLQLFCISVVVFFGTLQNLTAQRVSISVDDAVTKALETSKMLKASKAKITQANAKTSEMDASVLPTLAMSGGYTRLSNVPAFTFDNSGTITGLLQLLNALPGSTLQGQFNQQYIDAAGNAVRQASANQPATFPVLLDQIQVQLNAQQILFAGGRIDASKEIARLSAQASSYDLENDKLSIVYLVRQAYWAMYKAQSMRTSLDESAKQLSARIKDAEIMLKGGMLMPNDVLKLKVTLSNLQVQTLDIDNQIKGGMVAMNNLLGQPLSTELVLTTKPEESSNLPNDYESMIANARTTRPDILATAKRIDIAKSSVDVVNSGHYPTVAMTGNLTYANPNTRVFPLRQRFDATWALGVNFQWSLWNWNTTDYQVQQSQAQVVQAEESINALKDNIAVEVTQNYLSLEPARKRIIVSSEATKQAEENYSVISNRLKAGTATSTDVIEAETLLLQSKINTITALVDYELAYAKLQKSLGK